MTVFGPRCPLEASKSPPRASQEPAKSFPRGSQSLQKALHSLQEPPVRPPRGLQEPALQTFLHSLTEDTNPKAQSPPALLARAQHIATRCMQLHTPFFFMMPSCTYACRGCTYVLGTESEVAGATLDRRGANVPGSAWTPRHLHMRDYLADCTPSHLPIPWICNKLERGGKEKI